MWSGVCVPASARTPRPVRSVVAQDSSAAPDPDPRASIQHTPPDARRANAAHKVDSLRRDITTIYRFRRTA